jgi:transposase-like protein
MNKMRLNLILPVVDPRKITQPEQCPDPKCHGQYFQIRQIVKKAVRDTQYSEVKALRYTCLKCRRTFLVYPQGVQAAQISQRIKGMAVMLYLLGLSYGAVELMLAALGSF